MTKPKYISHTHREMKERFFTPIPKEDWGRMIQHTTYHFWNKSGAHWATICKQFCTADTPMLHNAAQRGGIRIKCGECQRRRKTAKMDKIDRIVDYPQLDDKGEYDYVIGYDPEKKMYFATAYDAKYGEHHSQTLLFHSWKEALEELRKGMVKYA